MTNKQDPNYNGYQWTKVATDSPYYPMSHEGNIVIHRLIMAQHLGRCLTSGEVVHHLNRRKQDNRLDNLMLLEDNKIHVSMHKLIGNATRQMQIEAYEKSLE